MNKNPVYGKWLPQKTLLRFLIAALSASFLALFIDILFIRIFMAFIALWSALIFLNLEFSAFLISRNKARFVRDSASLLIKHIKTVNPDRILDLGTGSGILAIQAAKKFNNSAVYAVDTWGRNQVFSKKLCMGNAEAEAVGDKITFFEADALDLPFGDNCFDLVISNYVLHSIKSGLRINAFKELYRVLQPGGQIVLQDLFIKEFYGDIDNFIYELQQNGFADIVLMTTTGMIKIPAALRLAKIASYTGILTGTKKTYQLSSG